MPSAAFAERRVDHHLPPRSLYITARAVALFSLGIPAHATAPGEGFDVLRHELALRPNLALGTVSGEQTIRLRVTAARLDQISFSANALDITQAWLGNRSLQVRRDDNALSFDMPRPLVRGQLVSLRLIFQGKPARGFVARPDLLYTSYFACDWMICAQERFGDKALFSLSLRLPAGLDSLSVGRRVSARVASDGEQVHRWIAPRPYSAYLYGFAIGRFQHGGNVRLAYLRTANGSDDLNRRFSETAAMTDFLAKRAGLSLPVARYTQLLVPGTEAQEAATYAVLGTEVVPAAPGDAERDWAIVHELAHQWWGNLITCERLQHFWLNEGIVTFMTAAWKEHRFGRAAYDAEMNLARQRLERARAIGFDKPLAWDGKYPSLAARRAVQYSKGALFMDHLRNLLGEDAFWAGLRRYTRTHAGGTVTSPDLQSAMERESRRDLSRTFDTWVYVGPG